MMRRLVAVAVAIVFLSTSNSALAGSTRDQTPAEKAASLKQQVVGIPAGAVIELKLQQKGSRKITGKLGVITDEGFEVQTVQSGQVTNQKVAFADVKSIKEKRGTSRVTKGLAITGVVLGILLIVGIVLAAVGVNN